MFKRKKPVVVGITTVYHECLGISVPGVSRLGRNVILVIYNDNPDVKLKRRQIRRYGYRGKLFIVNGTEKLGQLRARLEILKAVQRYKLKAQWIVFSDDDDILLSADVPNVADNNFAVLQNMVVLRTRLVDVLRVMRDSNNYTVDNENVYLVRPHMGLAGTLVRINVAQQMADVLCRCMDKIVEIDVSLGVRPPVDMMMWSVLNIIARAKNDFATPIYMDKVDYIAVDLDTAREKYGMRLLTGKNAGVQVRGAIEKYNSVIQTALAVGVPQETETEKNMIETDA